MLARSKQQSSNGKLISDFLLRGCDPLNSSELNLLKILRESSESVVVEKRSKPGTFKALRLRASKSMSEKNGCLLNSDNPSVVRMPIRFSGT